MTEPQWCGDCGNTCGDGICIFSEQGRLIEKLDGPPVGSGRWLGPTDVVIRDSSIVVADPPSGRVVI
jgi:hypothetical protein